MLYVIRRDWQEWVEAFSTLAEAQARFDVLKAEQPEWNLQILSEGEHTGVVFPSDMSLHDQGLTKSSWAAQRPPCRGVKYFAFFLENTHVELDKCRYIQYT